MVIIALVAIYISPAFGQVSASAALSGGGYYWDPAHTGGAGGGNGTWYPSSQNWLIPGAGAAVWLSGGSATLTGNPGYALLSSSTNGGVSASALSIYNNYILLDKDVISAPPMTQSNIGSVRFGSGLTTFDWAYRDSNNSNTGVTWNTNSVFAEQGAAVMFYANNLGVYKAGSRSIFTISSPSGMIGGGSAFWLNSPNFNTSIFPYMVYAKNDTLPFYSFVGYDFDSSHNSLRGLVTANESNNQQDGVIVSGSSTSENVRLTSPQNIGTTTTINSLVLDGLGYAASNADITGNGALVINSGALLVLTSPPNFANPVVFPNGVEGRIFMGSDAGWNRTHYYPNIRASFSGTGGLTLTGQIITGWNYSNDTVSETPNSDTMTLSGNSSYTGVTTLNAIRVAIQSPANFGMSDSVVLNGYATLASTDNNFLRGSESLTLNAGSMLDAGGLTTPVNNVTFGSGSVGVTMTANTTLYANGSVAIGVGAVLNLALPGIPQTGQSFTLISGAPISGVFQQVNATYQGVTYPLSVSYSGNSLVAKFGTGSPQSTSITVTTSPSGLAFSVDGIAYTVPQVFQWTPASTHTIAVASSPQAAGTGIQSAYSSWSDGGAQTHAIAVPSAATTYMANFTTQYSLTTLASPAAGGTISPASQWVNVGTVVPIGASANTGYQFTGFSGVVSGTTTPVNLTVNAPATVTANFTATASVPVAVTVTTSPSGLAFGVDGATYATPQVFQWTPASTHTIAVASSPQAAGTGIQNVYGGWSDGGAQTHAITVPSSATTYKANFTTQYSLTTQANPAGAGSIAPASQWVNSGTVVAVSASANSGYQFAGFAGAVSGTTTPVNLTVNAPATVTANFTASGTGGGGGTWYTSWSYRKAITISHTQVSGASNMTNLPVLISLAADTSLAANAQPGGNDILFTDAGGVNKLNHEIESYDAETGQLVAWVQVPSVSPAVDTVVYMYFGNPSASNQQNKASVWDANYQGVWHLPRGSAFNAADSTSRGNNGTIANAQAAAGEIGGAANFNGANASVDLGGGAGLAITGPITAEAWINVTAWPANGYPAGLLGMGYNYSSNRTGWMLQAGTDNGGNHYLSWTSNNGATHGVASASTIMIGTWHHVVGTFDGATWKMYLDGAPNGTSADATAPVSTGDNVVAGGLSTNGFGTIFLFNGLMDEMRVSNTARSSDWIATEHHNQSNPGSFLTVGPTQTGTAGSTVATMVTTSPAGLAFAVDGTTYTESQVFQWTPASTHTISVASSPQAAGTGIQSVYSSWSDGGAQTHAITVPSSATTYKANFTTQYSLTTQASPTSEGTISPGGQWVNGGTEVPISAEANSGYRFTGFSGAASGTTSPMSLTVNAPATVTANFTASAGVPVPVTVTTSPSGLAFAVDGTTYTAAQVFQWTPASTHTIAVVSSPQAAGTGIQNVYSGWSDGGAQAHAITVPSSATTYKANFTTQYFLTTLASPAGAGTIAPASQWVNSGTVVAVSASANSGYQFTSFAGAVSGTATPVNLTVNAPATVTANFTASGTGSGGSTWYTSWSYRKVITISHTRVSGASNLTNLPVLISLAADSNLAANAQSGGNDILFTDAGGVNKLNHEIESYDPATGQLVAWVQVPSVSPAVDTVVYMYFGNPSAGNQQNKAAVWDANYQGVWHLPRGSALNAADSTSRGNNGTVANAQAAAGEIGGAANFNGNASVDLGGGAGLAITGPITAEAWINVTAWPANGYPAGLLGAGYNYSSSRTGWMLQAGTDNGGNHYLSWSSTNGVMHGVVSASTLPTGTWHHVVGTFDGATWKMYLDGAPIGSSVDATPPVSTGNRVAAGGLSTNGYGTIFLFNGLMDEMRVSNAARSSDWIATEHHNQSNPATFLAVGAIQTAP